jgi:hypothetical protein
VEHLINEISAYSILFPVSAALLRIARINRIFLPFLLLIFCGAANEGLSILLMKEGYTNELSINIYCLVESLLVLWLFWRLRLFTSKKQYFSITLIFVLVWVADVFFISGINRFCSYFIMVTSFVNTLLSITLINTVIIYERRNFLRNPAFIISVCFIIYFATSFLVECFLKNSNGQDEIFLSRMQQIFDASNLLTNLLYTLAIVWMPTRLRYTRLY